jgi:hypothetical protein
VHQILATPQAELAAARRDLDQLERLLAEGHDG